MEGVGRGLDIDTTTDIIDVGEGSIVKGTGPIDGTTDGLNVVESADGGEGGVIGDEKGSADFGELRERGVCQAGAVDKGEGASDGGQVWCGDTGEGGVKESQVACDICEGIKADGSNVTERRVLNGEECRETDSELRRVGGNAESTIDFLELRLRDRLEETIVVYKSVKCLEGESRTNVKVVDSLEGESVEGRQLCIRNEDVADRVDSKGHCLQQWEDDKVDASDSCQAGCSESLQGSQVE